MRVLYVTLLAVLSTLFSMLFFSAPFYCSHMSLIQLGPGMHLYTSLVSSPFFVSLIRSSLFVLPVHTCLKPACNFHQLSLLTRAHAATNTSFGKFFSAPISQLQLFSHVPNSVWSQQLSKTACPVSTELLLPPLLLSPMARAKKEKKTAEAPVATSDEKKPHAKSVDAPCGYKLSIVFRFVHVIVAHGFSFLQILPA